MNEEESKKIDEVAEEMAKHLIPEIMEKVGEIQKNNIKAQAELGGMMKVLMRQMDKIGKQFDIHLEGHR